MRNGSDACPRLRESYSRYQCPSCGLTVPSAETTKEAAWSLRSASPQRNTPEQASSVKERNFPTTSVKLKDPPPIENAAERGIPAAELRHLDGEPLTEREKRIMKLLYGGNGCPTCARLSRGATP
jgi:hypothetical protein